MNYDPEMLDGIRQRNHLPHVIEKEISHGRGVKGDPRVPIEGYKALVGVDEDEEKDGRLFNIVTDDYQLVRHEEVIAMAQSVVAEMPEYGEPRTRLWLPQNGAKMRAEWRFPEVEYEVESGDLINPKFEMFNSYDGGWALRGMFGAFRLICTNGLTVGVKFAQYRREHHQPMNGTEDLKKIIILGMEQMSDQIELWKTWVDKVTTLKDYETVMTGMKWNKKEEEALGHEIEKSSGITIDDAKMRTLSYWLFYNLVAQFITHKVESAIRLERLRGRMQRMFRG
jgi:hypothetical protein